MSYGISYRPPKNTLPSFNDQLFTPVDNSLATENLVINIEEANTNQTTTISANNSLIDAFTSSFSFQSYTIPVATGVPNLNIQSIPVTFLGEAGKTYMININGSCNNATFLYYIQLIMTNGEEVQYQYGTPLTCAKVGDTVGPKVFSFSKTFLTKGTGATVYLTYQVRCDGTTTVFNPSVAFNSSANYTTPTVTILTL
jgi:hypothetical protein